MNPSTGRFVSMDSYEGSIYDPVSLHKYLYANGNPVIYGDPTGYASNLSEQNTVVSIIGILQKMAASAIRGGFSGGIIASIDYALGQYDQGQPIKPEELRDSFVEGFKSGAIAGMAFGGLGIASKASSKAVQYFAKKGMLFLTGSGVVAGGAAAIESIQEGNTSQAAYRVLLSAYAFRSAKKFHNDIKNNGGCFTEGTLVATEDGYKPIEEIEIGDYVWSENPVTGEIELKKVVQTFVRCKDELILIYVGNEVIKTTSEHPFYVEGRGWIAAGKLEVDDTLILINGEAISVDKIEVVELGEKINVYNFEVEDFHTYFVGNYKCLVHNSYKSTNVNESSKKVINSAGETVTRKFVTSQDELLAVAEEAAGGDLDSFYNFKENYYIN